MSNEMFNREKLFLPKEYKLFLDKVSRIPNDDIFNLNNNTEFLLLLKRLINKYEVHEVNYVEVLFIKLVAGDKSDNISSAWTQVSKNGKKRGIGDKGAKTIYEEYIGEFGEVNLNDVDLFENIADIICEKKKISKTKIEPMVENIKFNSRLIDLRVSNLPNEVVDIMSVAYKETCKNI